MALKIDIAANTRQAQAQVKDLGESLEKVGGSLDEVARDGKAAGEKLERTFRDMGKDADEAGRDIKKGIGKGLKETADEAKQSGREAAASFSGEFSDVGDFLQETVAQGLGGFGPIGLAAGLAGAAGIGLVTAELQRQQQETDLLKQRFSDMYQQAAEDGLNYVSTAAIIANTNDLMFNPDRAREWADVQADAVKIGIDANTVALARNGHEESLNVTLAATAAARDALKAKAEDGGATAIRLATAEVQEYEKLRREYEGIGALHDSNKDSLKAAQEIANGLHEEERAQIQRTKDAAQARYEALAAQAANPIKLRVELQDDTATQMAGIVSRLQGRRVTVGVGTVLLP